MDELPDEIIPAVASYLPPLDTLRLNNTSKTLRSKLSLTACSPRLILTDFSRGDRDDDLHHGFQIPVPRQAPCHSVLLALTWRDQGWGNRKGRIVIAAAEGGRVRPAPDPRCGEDVVYASGIAEHAARRIDVTFRPKDGETYHLWYVVGGGGGHSLHLSNVRIQILVLDDPGRCFGEAYNTLAKTGDLGVWDQPSRPQTSSGRRPPPRRHPHSSASPSIVHRDMDQFLSTLGERPLPPSISPANVSDHSAATSELKFRAFVRSLWESWIEEYFAYAKSLHGARVPRRFGRHNIHPVQADDFLEDRMDFGEFVVLGE